MTRPYFIETQTYDEEQRQRIESLEAALRYIRNELTRWHCTIGFDHILDRIDAVLPSQLAQDITEWCNTYDKRVVLVRHSNGALEVDPEFIKEQS